MWNFAADFFNQHMVAVYFIYGLAFFVLGLAIALENRRTGALKLWASLWFLAVYGMLHGLEEWAEMFYLIQAPAPEAPSGHGLHLIATILLPVSTAFLVHFGATLIASVKKNLGWLVWAAPASFAIWVTFAWFTYSFGNLEYGQWLRVSSALARYLIYLPGSILSALGMALYVGVFKEMNAPGIAGSCRLAAIAFSVNAVIAGLIVPPAPFYPASVFNYHSFFTTIEVPPQVIRTILAIVIAILMVRVLRIFQVQQAQQLENAYQDRYRAQKAALEMQRLAHEAAEQWNKELEKKVYERTQELELRNRELLAINGITVTLASSFEVRKVLRATLDRISETMNIEISAIYLSNEETGRLALEVSNGISGDALSPYLPAEFPGSIDLQAHLNVLTADSTFAGCRGVVIGDLDDGPHVCLFVPIRSKESTRGVALMARRGSTNFAQHEVDTLLTVCRQIAVALDNARLHEQVQNIAVLEERDRIAREMHDGLAQILGYLNLETYSFEDLLRNGKTKDVHEGIRQLRKIVQDAYADVRESILNLRTAVWSERGLIPTLEQYVREYSQQSKVDTELVVTEDVPARIPQAMEVQLVRIIQEALTNVRKHANATQATLKFEKPNGALTVTIEDNGCGFDVDYMQRELRGHYGIQSMGERVQSIGGTFAIESARGKGTKVSIALPLETEGGN